jgi:hypothetical protein
MIFDNYYMKCYEFSLNRKLYIVFIKILKFLFLHLFYANRSHKFTKTIHAKPLKQGFQQIIPNIMIIPAFLFDALTPTTSWFFYKQHATF